MTTSESPQGELADILVGNINVSKHLKAMGVNIDYDKLSSSGRLIDEMLGLLSNPHMCHILKSDLDPILKQCETSDITSQLRCEWADFLFLICFPFLGVLI